MCFDATVVYRSLVIRNLFKHHKDVWKGAIFDTWVTPDDFLLSMTVQAFKEPNELCQHDIIISSN